MNIVDLDYPIFDQQEPLCEIHHDFCWVYYLGIFLIIGIEVLADIEASSGMSFVLGGVGSMGMAWSFTRDHDRMPTKPEKRRLVIGHSP